MKASASMNPARMLLVAGFAAAASLSAYAGPSDYRYDQLGTAKYNHETSVIYDSFQSPAGAGVQRGTEAAPSRGAAGPVRADAGMGKQTLGDPFARLGGIGGANTP